MIRQATFAITCLLLALAGVGTAAWADRKPVAGIASWYGAGLDGQVTANGETFDKDALTAAHRELPFGSAVRVTNVSNGRSVVVRINDRGPASADRILDVSERAAEALGFKAAGTAPVVIEVVDHGAE